MAPSGLADLQVARDVRGVVTVSLDVPGHAYNVLGEDVIAELRGLVEELEQDPAVRLVLFRSAKESGFLAGGGLRSSSQAALKSSSPTG